MLIWRARFETNFETPWEEGEGPFFSRITQEVFSEKVAPEPGGRGNRMWLYEGLGKSNPCRGNTERTGW